MMEASKVVPRRSTVFIDYLTDPCSRYQFGFFFRVDEEGRPYVMGIPFTLVGGKWSNVGFCNELLFFRSAYNYNSYEEYLEAAYPDEGDPDYKCYVANNALMQLMRIPSLPFDDYSIVGLGLTRSDSDLWKLVAVLKSNLVTTSSTVDLETGVKVIPRSSMTFDDEGFVKIGIFDPKTEAWTTEPAKFSDDFKKNNFRSDASDLFYLNSSPVYHEEALYWVHGWNAKGPENPYYARYPWNICVGGGPDGDERKQLPLSLLRLRLKTNLFRLIHMPLNDKRNVGLLCKSEEEGLLIYCHLCPTEGLSVWVLDHDDHNYYMPNFNWRQKYYVPAERIDFWHNDRIREEYIEHRVEYRELLSGIGIPDEILDRDEDMTSKVCNRDFVSVHAFDEELHTLLFKVSGCRNHFVCFDFKEEKLVSAHLCHEYKSLNMVPHTHLEVDPDTPLRQVARMWAEKRKARYIDSTVTHFLVFGVDYRWDLLDDLGNEPIFLISCGVVHLKTGLFHDVEDGVPILPNHEIDREKERQREGLRFCVREF
ncbi:hypothetical protein H6P81_000391 [Aristolochia fimbriata]|uniref:F-box associated domain-containing protein n=1 Tax=Aristolochia fimbriata TaxID=158543 RepID=A0AAV7F8H6_ARIFI|nr:hypothetical protein H6P81_000391 [Aristolochia fimbriata]